MRAKVLYRLMEGLVPNSDDHQGLLMRSSRLQLKDFLFSIDEQYITAPEYATKKTSGFGITDKKDEQSLLLSS